MRYQLGIDIYGMAGYPDAMPRTRATVLAERAEAARGLGTRLAGAREQAGLTQAAAARAIGIPQSRIAKLELGLRQLGFLEGLRLAALYRVECGDLDPFAMAPPEEAQSEPERALTHEAGFDQGMDSRVP
jgi:DNA-binding XRE family transcriptional regulator